MVVYIYYSSWCRNLYKCIHSLCLKDVSSLLLPSLSMCRNFNKYRISSSHHLLCIREDGKMCQTCNFRRTIWSSSAYFLSVLSMAPVFLQKTKVFYCFQDSRYPSHLPTYTLSSRPQCSSSLCDCMSEFT